MMKNKIAFFTGAIAMAIAMGFSFGGVMAVAFAEVIPGVDEPYDPTAYYSPTAISWADSAPSEFALDDLAANGGSVYDYTRHIKSLIFGERFKDILSVESDKTKQEELNTKNWSESSVSSTLASIINLLKSFGGEHMDKYGNVTGGGYDFSPGSVADTTTNIISRLGENHSDNVTYYDFSTQAGGLFWAGGSYDGDEFLPETSWAKQAKWIRNATAEITQSASNIESDQKQILAANAYVTQMSGESEGAVQELIANTAARSVKTQAIVDRNELIAKVLQMMSIDWMEQMDSEEHAKDIEDSYHYYVADPYDDAGYKYAKDAYGIEKMKGNGMPDFK